MDYIISLEISFFAVRGFRCEVTENGLALQNTLSFTWLLLFLFFMLVTLKCIHEKDRRRMIYATLFGVIIGIFYTLGISLEKKMDLNWIWENTDQLADMLNLFFSQSMLYSSAAYLAFSFLQKQKDLKPARISQSFCFKRALLFWVILIILYLPWYLYCYPAVITPDSADQISDAITTDSIRDHHSAFLTLMMRFVILPVRQFTGSLQSGVGVTSLLQMLIVTFVFACTYEQIRCYVNNKLIRGIIFLWYGMFPVNNFFSVTLWKDILFSTGFLGFLLCINDAAENENDFFGSRWKKHAILLLIMILLPLMRHNGILVVLVTAAGMLLRFRKQRKQIFMIIGGFCLAFGSWKLLLLPALNAAKIDPCHVYSVLEQQMTRAMNTHHEELSDEEMKEFTKYFDITDLWTRYNPIYSDSVKRHFRNDLFEQDPLGFFRSWAKLGKRYPIEYIEAFLANNYGYWFPETRFVNISTGVTPLDWDLEDVHSSPILKPKLLTMIQNFMENDRDIKIPLLPLLTSRGAYWWLWLFCGIWCLYQNRQKFILFLPGLALWMSILISPVYNEYRYVYGLFIGLPLLMSSVFSRQKNCIHQNKE